MPEITEVSTLTEKQLCTLEDKIRRGSAAFVEVGKALATIREGKGYKLRGFDTFEAYCEKVFGITDRHGRRLIQSAETSQAVKKLTGDAPANESVAREFAPLVAEPEKLKKVTEQLEKKGYSVITATAEAVKEAVQKLAPKPKPAPLPADGKAVVIPGNGHKTETAPEEEPTGTDVCPACGKIPVSYRRSGKYWGCGNCNASVSIHVTLYREVKPIVSCPACKKEFPKPPYPFCPHCGGRLS